MKLKDYFESYIEYLKDKGYSELTITEHRRFLLGALSHSVSNIFIHRLHLTDTAKVIKAGRDHGEYGSQRAVICYRQLLKYLKESGQRLNFDWRDIEVPRVPQGPVEFLTKEELSLIRDSLPDTAAGLRTRALMELLIDTGMRISEAISINRTDIDWDKREIQVINIKTKERELVYLTDRSIDWLKKYLSIRRDDHPALFLSGRGRLLSVTARNYLRTHTKDLGIKKHIKHHIFRKTFVTYLIQHNVDIKSVQTLARHKSERTTLRYYAGISKERAKKLHQGVMMGL